jgi:hypothetical protein
MGLAGKEQGKNRGIAGGAGEPAKATRLRLYRRVFSLSLSSRPEDAAPLTDRSSVKATAFGEPSSTLLGVDAQAAAEKSKSE